MTNLGVEVVGLMMLIQRALHFLPASHLLTSVLRVHALYFHKSRLFIAFVAFILLAETIANVYLLIYAGGMSTLSVHTAYWRVCSPPVIQLCLIRNTRSKCIVSNVSVQKFQLFLTGLSNSMQHALPFRPCWISCICMDSTLLWHSRAVPNPLYYRAICSAKRQRFYCADYPQGWVVILWVHFTSPPLLVCYVFILYILLELFFLWHWYLQLWLLLHLPGSRILWPSAWHNLFSMPVQLFKCCHIVCRLELL